MFRASELGELSTDRSDLLMVLAQNETKLESGLNMGYSTGYVLCDIIPLMYPKLNENQLLGVMKHSSVCSKPDSNHFAVTVGEEFPTKEEVSNRIEWLENLIFNVVNEAPCYIESVFLNVTNKLCIVVSLRPVETNVRYFVYSFPMSHVRPSIHHTKSHGSLKSIPSVQNYRSNYSSSDVVDEDDKEEENLLPRVSAPVGSPLKKRTVGNNSVAPYDPEHSISDVSVSCHSDQGKTKKCSKKSRRVAPIGLEESSGHRSLPSDVSMVSSDSTFQARDETSEAALELTRFLQTLGDRGLFVVSMLSDVREKEVFVIATHPQQNNHNSANSLCRLEYRVDTVDIWQEAKDVQTCVRDLKCLIHDNLIMGSYYISGIAPNVVDSTTENIPNYFLAKVRIPQ